MQETVNHQQELAARLAEATADGLGRAKLLGSGKAKAAREAALAEMLTRGLVLESGSGRKAVLVLREHYRPPDYVAALRQQLEKAGEKGIARKALLGKGSEQAPREAALGELLARREIVALGTAKSPKFVLSRNDRRLETVCAAVEAKASPGAPRAFSEAQLFKGSKSTAEIRARALETLLGEGRLVQLQSGAKWDKALFVHAAALAPLLITGVASHRDPMMPPRDSGTAAPDDPAATIRAAYGALVRESGFADVLISDLQMRSGLPPETLGSWLLEASRRGAVLPGRGDWSLASEAARHAAISIGGEPHLRVRFA